MRKIAVFAFAVLCLATLLSAQVQTGSIRIKVTDVMAGVIPGAAVSLSHSTERFSQDVTTDDAGIVIVQDVPPGKVNIRASANGRTATTDVDVEAGNEAYVPIQMN